jgi:pimeloyl-ACP methyl ester carboxylesterase
MTRKVISLRPWRRRSSANQESPARIWATTGDGLRLAIHHVPPVSGRGPAVMLLHGMGSNRRAFHMPERSVARWLSARGFDCYVPELRGSGLSERRALNWDFDDHLEWDLPAVIDRILEASGEQELHWVGHSMGGHAALCYGILHPDAPIKSVVALGTALDYRIGASSFSMLLKAEVLLARLPAVPYGRLARIFAPLSGRLIPAPLDPFTAWKSNIDVDILRRSYAASFETVPMTLLRNLAQAFSHRGLRTRDWRTYFIDEADSFRFPLKLICGSRDATVSVAAVRDTAARLPGPVELRICGLEHGDTDEYGHWDLLVGKRADVEIWPEVASWVAAAAHESQRLALFGTA